MKSDSIKRVKTKGNDLNYSPYFPCQLLKYIFLIKMLSKTIKEMDRT